MTLADLLRDERINSTQFHHSSWAPGTYAVAVPELGGGVFVRRFDGGCTQYNMGHFAFTDADLRSDGWEFGVRPAQAPRPKNADGMTLIEAHSAGCGRIRRKSWTHGVSLYLAADQSIYLDDALASDWEVVA